MLYNSTQNKSQENEREEMKTSTHTVEGVAFITAFISPCNHSDPSAPFYFMVQSKDMMHLHPKHQKQFAKWLT